MLFAATCLLGLEGLLSNELKFSGLEGVRAENGRVFFEGDFSAMARANLSSRLAQRVLIVLARFEAHDFESLFQGARSAPWADFIGEKDAFPVKGSSVSSALSSIPACQKIIKKAVVEKLKDSYRTSWFEETGALHQIQFLIMKNEVLLMLDTSGDSLNKRGYRALSNDAPIKETLAASMAELSRVRADHTVVDPFCGSGTILIEAAMKAMNIMPGMNRSFAFERWAQFDGSVMKREKERARDGERRECMFEGFGFDVDERSLELARRNASLAGVGERLSFKKRDIRDYRDDFAFSTVITNPPYGERMLDREEAEELYRVMGTVFEKKPHHSYTVITPDERFEELFGRPADKKRKLYNGMLKCYVYQFFR